MLINKKDQIKSKIKESERVAGIKYKITTVIYMTLMFTYVFSVHTPLMKKVMILLGAFGTISLILGFFEKSTINKWVEELDKVTKYHTAIYREGGRKDENLQKRQTKSINISERNITHIKPNNKVIKFPGVN